MNEEFSYNVKIPHFVVKDRGISSLSKLIFGEILYYHERRGYYDHRDMDLARAYSVSRRTIQNCIRSLKKSGYIESTVNKLNGNSRRIFILKF